MKYNTKRALAERFDQASGSWLCLKCRRLKPLSDFPPLGESGVARSWCKECHSDSTKQRYRNDPEYRSRQKGRTARRYWENPAAAAAIARRNNLRRNYGITPERYDEMLAAQGGGCAICGNTPDSQPYGRLVVDHDHRTDEVRGLLCALCNGAIGMARDDRGLLRAMARYLSRYR